jgi:hypothetical protein
MTPENPQHVGGSNSTRLRAIVLVLIFAAGFALLRWTPVGDYVTEERLVGLLTETRQIWWAPMALSITPWGC